jgi:hypothetical protein
MGKRVYVLARELGMRTGELLARAHGLGFVKSKCAFANIRDVEAELVSLQFARQTPQAQLDARRARLKALNNALSIQLIHAQVSELFSVLEGMLREDDVIRNAWRYRHYDSRPPAVAKLIDEAVLRNCFTTASVGDLRLARLTRNNIVHRTPGAFPDGLTLRRVRNLLVAAILDYVERSCQEHLNGGTAASQKSARCRW